MAAGRIIQAAGFITVTPPPPILQTVFYQETKQMRREVEFLTMMSPLLLLLTVASRETAQTDMEVVFLTMTTPFLPSTVVHSKETAQVGAVESTTTNPRPLSRTVSFWIIA